MSNCNFWRKLPRPFVGLAPMDGVTDPAFRYIVAKYGRPDLIMTEFVPAEAVIRGVKSTLFHLAYNQIERPVVAQIFGSGEEAIYQTAIVVAALGFDGLDINMGCPDNSVVNKQKAGAGLIATPRLAGKIIRAASQGLQDWADGIDPTKLKIPTGYLKQAGIKEKTERRLIPLSIKTRVGVADNEIETWIGKLCQYEEISAISLHGRTLAQKYTGKANWEWIQQAGKLVKAAGKVMVGNGDIPDYTHGLDMAKQFGIDGVLIGRASFGNPWVFTNKPRRVERWKKLQVMAEQIEYFSEHFPRVNYDTQKKHLGWYCRGFAGAKELRMQLMKTKTSCQAKKLISA